MNRAEIKARAVQQEEQIGRRASIIAERRDTRAPDLERNQDLRSARRGDVGGAEALLQTLGLVEKGVSDFQTYKTNKLIDEEQDNKDRGALDAVSGNVDPVMMEKSLGYYNSVTKGRTVTNFAKSNQEFTTKLEQLINDQDDPNLEDRLAEVQKMTEEFYGDFAKDPETGQFRDYLQSPGAMRYLAEEIQTNRPKILAAAQTMIETKFKAESFSHFGQNVVDQALSTGTVDLVQARSLLPSIVTDAEFSEQAIVSVNNAVQALRDRGTPEALQQAAGLLAGLRQRSRAPIDPGLGVASPSGAPLAPAGNLAATGEAGEFAAAFKATGLSDPVIAGFLGNLKHESSFDSSRVGDNGSAFGHAQWRGERAENFRRIIGADPKNATPAQSVQFIKWELDNYQAAGMTKNQRDLILNAQTPEDAARAIDKYYERSDQRSTRDRMKAAREFFGAAPASPAEATAAPSAAAPAPGIRLTDPFADPITQLERSGEFVDIIGIEDVKFSPEQVAQIDELYDRTSKELRVAYRTAEREQQSVNATRLALGLSGIGGARTTSKDILKAFENKEIGAEDAMSLIDIQQRNLDRAEASAERAENAAERAERRREEKQTEAASESLLGELYSGRMTPAEVRSAALTLARKGRLSVSVSASVLSTVNTVANGFESLLEGSEPVQQRRAFFEEAIDEPEARILQLDPQVRPERAKAMAPQFADIAKRAGGRFIREVSSGVDPKVAGDNAEAFMIEEENKVMARLKRAPDGAGTGR